MDEDLRKLLENMRAAQDTEELYVSSFKEANVLLEAHMTSSGAEYRRKLVDYITSGSNSVRADCDVIHNFVMDLFRVGDYVLALDICDYALQFAPHNRDILGDAIKACGDSSQFDKGDEYLRTALEIPLDRWSYRLFLYSIDFLKTKLDADPGNDDLFKQTYDLAEEYIRVFPYDEHGYNQQAEILIAVNRREEAIDELKRAIYEIKPNVNDKTSSLICAQCCVTLLNLLDDSSDYEEIIKIADIGMKHTTQEQPSASIGFFMYRKALALDAKAHCNDFRKETVNEALICYQAAYDLNQGRAYARTIEQRYAVLRPHAEDYRPLVKRALYVEEQTES